MKSIDDIKIIMERIYECIQVFALFLTTLWFFTWLCECRSGSGWLFELKRQSAARWISSRKKNRTKILTDESRTMHKLIDGVVDKKNDSNVISYYGTDQKNNFIYIKINQRKNKHAEIIFFMGFEDGRTYELPDHPNTVIGNTGTTSWSAAGLTISVLESSRRMRIIFNGLMRKNIRTDIDCDNDNDIEHVRFNGIFIMNTKPYNLEEFWSSQLKAEALAKNSWKKSQWQQFIEKLDINEIDQYGSIMTQVTFEDSSILELFLRGIRQSQWGKLDAAHFDRKICLTGLDDLGTSFHLILYDVKDGLKSARMGHLKNSMDMLYPIQSLTFEMDQFWDKYENGFDEYSFQFSTEKRNYEAIIMMKRKNQRTVYGGYPWDSQYTFCNFKLMLNNSAGTGMIQLLRPYKGTCPITLSTIPRFVKIKNFEENSNVYTLLFNDKRCQNENLVGGKGASLAELSSMETSKFIVPKGFSITAHALDLHISHHANINEAIDDFVKICCGEKIGHLKEHSEKVVTLLENTPVLESIVKEILEALGQLNIDDTQITYAVRSSAIGEDSEDTSAAGQNSTFIGIKKHSDIITSVACCWASLYTYQSVEYRRQNGLPIKVSMGVCVQQMVNAEAAGVMFTRHPISGNQKEILITSNYGLGESVVSALVDPDTIIVQRNRLNILSIKTSKIGKKDQKVTINSEGGTVHINMSEEEASKLSISPNLILKLAEIGFNLDQLYDAPRDIEWAISKNNVYLLQSRPVTALDSWTDFELTHELGSGAPSDNDIFTFANVGEVLPMVLTPLTLSTIVHSLNVSTENNITKERVINTYTSHMFIGNMRVTLNYVSLFLRYIEDKITLGNKVTEIAVCGHSVITPEIHRMGIKRNGGAVTSYERFMAFYDMINDVWKNGKALKTADKIVKKCRTLPIAKNINEMTSIMELYEMLAKVTDNFMIISGLHSHASKCSIFSQVMVMSILSEGSEDLTMEHYSDIAILLGSCSDVISAQVPLALKEITRIIKEAGLNEQFKIINSSEAMEWLQKNCPEAYKKVQEFIKIHGHRGIEEFDLITETWGMKPEKFLATIRSMLNTPDDNSNMTSSAELSPRETVALLKTPKKSLTRWIISLLLPWMRRSVSQRETTKCLIIEVVHIIRLGYRRLAELLFKEVRLPEKDLIFFLTHKELAELIEKPNPALIRKAVRRRKIRPKLQKYQYPELNFGMLKPIEKPKMTSQGTGVKIQGTSVCNGIVTGRACVALTLEEAADIRPGDILITHATDIGWSPYFPILAGVVTELGGLISHGAVVAREYGLPCIVSAENATSTFSTGDTVTLNGYAGTIEIMKEVARESADSK